MDVVQRERFAQRRFYRAQVLAVKQLRFRIAVADDADMVDSADDETFDLELALSIAFCPHPVGKHHRAVAEVDLYAATYFPVRQRVAGLRIQEPTTKRLARR